MDGKELTEAMKVALMNVQAGKVDGELIKSFRAYMVKALPKFPTPSAFMSMKKDLALAYIKECATINITTNLLKSSLCKNLLQTRPKSVAAVHLHKLQRKYVGFTHEGHAYKIERAEVRRMKRARDIGTSPSKDEDLEDPEYVNDEKVVTQVQKNFPSRAIVKANRDGEMPLRLLTCDSTSAETWKKLKDGPMTKFADLVKEHTGHGATLVIGSPPWGVLTDDKGGRLKSKRKKARESKADKEEADGAAGDGDDGQEGSDKDELWRTASKDKEYQDVPLTETAIRKLVRVDRQCRHVKTWEWSPM